MKPKASSGKRSSVAGVNRFLPALLVVVVFFVGLAILASESKQRWFVGFYALMSVLSFSLYGLDKRASARGGWRTPEARLHLVELLGGLARCFAGAAGVPPQDPQDVVPGGVLPGGGGQSGGAGVVALCGWRAGLAGTFRIGGTPSGRPLARGLLRCPAWPRAARPRRAGGVGDIVLAWLMN